MAEQGADIILALLKGPGFPIDMVEIENRDKMAAAPKEFDFDIIYLGGEIILDPEDADETTDVAFEEAEITENEE
jgi:hypothetical protein